MTNSATPPITPAEPASHPAQDVILAQVATLTYRLAEVRQQCAEYNAALDTLFDRFYAEPHVQALATQLHDAQAAQEQADAELRTAMIAAYQILGITRWNSTGEIRLMHEVAYHCSDSELLAVVKAHMPDVVIRTEQVDRRKLEKRLRTEPDTHLPGVQVNLTPKAFISTDLSGLLHPEGLASEGQEDHP